MKLVSGICRLGIVALIALLAACSTTTKPGAVGVSRQQFLLVPAETVERMATLSYNQQAQEAKKAGKLVTSGEEYERLKRVADRVRAQVGVFREDTDHWKWQLVLIDAPIINATCAPGGKITFYTGIIRKLALTDDEIAAVMGHEIAHALREHGRERVSLAVAQNAITGAALAASRNSSNVQLANQFAHYLFVLPNSRQNETEADGIGLELAARAGYDPRAAITLWQKMTRISGGGSGEFFSTHPSGETRINDLTALMPKVMPLYEQAARQTASVTTVSIDETRPDNDALPAMAELARRDAAKRGCRSQKTPAHVGRVIGTEQFEVLCTSGRRMHYRCSEKACSPI